MKFKEFREVDICNQRSSIGYCFFFCFKTVQFAPALKGYFIIRGIHMTAITHVGLAVPDLDAAIKWYEQVLGFKLLAGPYSFDASEENEHNMTNDLLGVKLKSFVMLIDGG